MKICALQHLDAGNSPTRFGVVSTVPVIEIQIEMTLIQSHIPGD